VSSQTLFSGEHYQALSDFLGAGCDNLSDEDRDDDGANFVVTHDLSIAPGHTGRVRDFSSFAKFKESWEGVNGNRVLFLRGYPSRNWLCNLGAKLDLDFTFLNTHFSNPSQFNAAENLWYPAQPLTGSKTIQLTITSVGTWDNYRSAISLEEARRSFQKEMKAYILNVNKGHGLRTCDSVVRDFYLHDLNHFSFDQTVTLHLMQRDSAWTGE